MSLEVKKRLGSDGVHLGLQDAPDAIVKRVQIRAPVLKVNLIDSAAICSEASKKDDLMSSFKGNHDKIATHHFFWDTLYMNANSRLDQIHISFTHSIIN